uniref:Uncharacterized protein n=1 Tax=Anopheles epiroticus TaxID=199890 RepID=A0A182P6U0_9DIPT
MLQGSYAIIFRFQLKQTSFQHPQLLRTVHHHTRARTTGSRRFRVLSLPKARKDVSVKESGRRQFADPVIAVLGPSDIPLVLL